VNNSDQPAFPTKELLESTDVVFKKGGLTKREYFAGLALQGFLSRDINNMDGSEIVGASISYADELLQQLEEF
jgi:hypothetical protein